MESSVDSSRRWTGTAGREPPVSIPRSPRWYPRSFLPGRSDRRECDHKPYGAREYRNPHYGVSSNGDGSGFPEV